MRLHDKNGQIVFVRTNKTIGDGHEACVFPVDDTTLAKLYRRPETYQNPHDRAAASVRIAAHQTKLLEFPDDLPTKAITPSSPLWQRSGSLWWKKSQIVGYLMPWVQDAQQIDYYMRAQSRDDGVTDETVVRALMDFHRTLGKLHKKGFVIGDLNHGNVLVKGADAWAIDLDAGQFDSYLCDTFDPDYLDPLLIDMDTSLHAARLDENKHFCADSDWYAFACMVLACFTYVKPYQGAYIGNTPDGRRPHERLTIFHPKVKFPQYGNVRHWKGFLPDDLIEYFIRVFNKDMRGEFPISLLEDLLPGRSKKPTSPLRTMRTGSWPNIIKSMQFDGYVFDLLVQQSRGALDPVTRTHGDRLHYLTTGGGSYIRENKHVVISGETDHEYEARGQHRFHIIHGADTICVEKSEAAIHSPNRKTETFTVDRFGEMPSIASNGELLAWFTDKKLYLTSRDVAKSEVLFESQHDNNMIWLTDNGLLISYQTDGSGVQVSLTTGRKTVNLETDFQHNRPLAMRVFSNQEYLWIWSWHAENIAVHRCTHNGTDMQRLQMDKDWAPNPEHVCLQAGHFLGIDHKNKLQEFDLAAVVTRKKLAKLPFKGIWQLLPHPQGGIAVITTLNEIWQIA